jgi:hypothetical protein
VGPVYGGFVIVVNQDGFVVGYGVKEIEILKDVCDMLKAFCAFINGIDFSFS